MKLHISQLIEAGACKKQVNAFSELFGTSVEVTAELCVPVADKFDWSWASRNLLSPPALAEYRRVTAQALAEYERVKAQAWAEYRRVRALALAEYWCVTAQGLAERERVKAQAWAEYRRVTAPAWANAYNSQEPQP